jgi:hypothetical protein
MLGATVLIPFLLVPAMGGDGSGALIPDSLLPASGLHMHRLQPAAYSLQMNGACNATLIPPAKTRQRPHPPADLANVICTIFFVSGLITLAQTFFGDRLPIIQGGSFAYLTRKHQQGQLSSSHVAAGSRGRHNRAAHAVGWVALPTKARARPPE